MPVPVRRTADFVEVVGEELLKALRVAACPPGKKALWLHKYLDDQQLAEIYYRIFKKSEDLSEVAKYIKSSWGIKPKWQTRDFVVGLTKWKNALTSTFQEYIDTRENQDQTERARKKLEVERKLAEEIDVLAELAYSIKVARKRIEWAHAREEVPKIPIPQNDAAIATHQRLILSYTDLKRKLLGPDIETPEININLKMQSDQALEFIGSDGQKFIRAGQKFLKRLEEKTIQLERNPETGEYEEVTHARKVSEFVEKDE